MSFAAQRPRIAWASHETGLAVSSPKQKWETIHSSDELLLGTPPLSSLEWHGIALRIAVCLLRSCFCRERKAFLFSEQGRGQKTGPLNKSVLTVTSAVGKKDGAFAFSRLSLSWRRRHGHLTPNGRNCQQGRNAKHVPWFW